MKDKIIKVFNILNNVETIQDLNKLHFKLVDLEFSKIAFYDLQKSFNDNNGKRATCRTLNETTANFYKKHGFNVSNVNGYFVIAI